MVSDISLGFELWSMELAKFGLNYYQNATMGNIFSQSYFIAEPALTEKNLADLKGKVSRDPVPLPEGIETQALAQVFIVTGGNSGCGFELVKLLYQKNGTVYVAGRSTERCTAAIEKIKAEFAEPGGRLEFLKVDLGDLTTIRRAAEEFMGMEERLDVLWNNAGVMEPPKGSVTAQVCWASALARSIVGGLIILPRSQGYELQVGTNCLGHFLFTQLLHPILRRTAATSPVNTVRVAWAGSLAIDFYTPNGGVDFDEKGDVKYQSQKTSYGVSKAGNLFLASEFGKRTREEGIVSVVFNPGNLATELQKTMSKIERYILVRQTFLGKGTSYLRCVLGQSV